MLQRETKVMLFLLGLTGAGFSARIFYNSKFYSTAFSGMAIGIYIGEYVLLPRIRPLIGKR